MRNMMPKSLALLAGGALVAATTAHAEVDRDGWPSSFTVGTASQGGTFYIYGSGWANLLADQLGGITGGGEVTGGPTQNLALVHAGELAFGLTTLGPADDAMNGRSPLAPGVVMDNACALFPMYETPFSITALASTGITSISEIPDGSRIGFAPQALPLTFTSPPSSKSWASISSAVTAAGLTWAVSCRMDCWTSLPLQRAYRSRPLASWKFKPTSTSSSSPKKSRPPLSTPSRFLNS